jgi:hypothetical protein
LDNITSVKIPSHDPINDLVKTIPWSGVLLQELIFDHNGFSRYCHVFGVYVIYKVDFGFDDRINWIDLFNFLQQFTDHYLRLTLDF